MINNTHSQEASPGAEIHAVSFPSAPTPLPGARRAPGLPLTTPHALKMDEGEDTSGGMEEGNK